MSNFTFSRIVIIQSLGFNESPTGRQLREAIELTAKFNHDVAVELIEVQTASALLRAIHSVHTTVESTCDYPVLHLECHGLADRTGLSMGDGTSLTWSALNDSLTKLNEATRCNLFISLAACHGGYLFETLDILSRAPCWGMLGPSDVVNPADLVSSYSAFYLELLKTGNPDAALVALQNTPMRTGNYFLFTAEVNFSRVVQIHAAIDRANMIERIGRFSEMTKLLGMPLSDGWISSEFNNAERDVLKGFYTRYFFVDKYPENRLRFLDAYRALTTH